MLNIEDMYLEMGIRREVYDFGSQIAGTLKERFDASLSKCRTPEALAAHEARRIAALQIAKEFHIEGGSV